MSLKERFGNYLVTTREMTYRDHPTLPGLRPFGAILMDGVLSMIAKNLTQYIAH